jgi:hypothetical protein
VLGEHLARQQEKEEGYTGHYERVAAICSLNPVFTPQT